MPRFVDVAVPVALDQAFTYRAPPALEDAIAPGMRILVPFGRRVLVGVALRWRGDAPVEKVKEVLDVLDDPGHPALLPSILELCAWISDYYLSPIGEVCRLALPGLLAAGDARIANATDAGLRWIEGEGAPLLAGVGQHTVPLSSGAKRLLEALAAAGEEGCTMGALASLRPPIPGPLARLAELEEAGLAVSRWADDARGEARMELHLRASESVRGDRMNEEALREVLGRSKKRRALLDVLMTQEGDTWVSASELRGAFPRWKSLLAPLLEAAMVETCELPRKSDPFDVQGDDSAEPQSLTGEQTDALQALLAAREGGFATHLLHGITGSGKTEVYLQLIDKIRADGGGAIVLVPEISLTPQVSSRFRARFGDDVAVLHSGLTPRQRLDAWHEIRRGDRRIVIGARSAVFAPVRDLQVIVTDEEHDGSFKQEDGVRYHARDVGMIRARAVGALVVLGSATPSLESYKKAHEGAYGLSELKERPTPRPLPDVEILHLKSHRVAPDSLLSARLKSALLETVERGEQAILFLNRRGFTTMLSCHSCGAMQQCPDCSAPSMTFHQGRNRLMCHLCGYVHGAPTHCLACKKPTLDHGAAGTERVEQSLEQELEGVRIARLDRDTGRGRRLLTTLERFRAREADVLVGTQMLSKGHDFPGVTLVGILRGDHGLSLPDLRASERVFQLLTQVSGRAGRGDRPGRVIVQTWLVDHPAIAHAANHDFEAFAQDELERREALGNPPFGHLALVRVTGLDAGEVRDRIEGLARHCREDASRASVNEEGAPRILVLGPVAAPIERLNRKYRWQLLLRADDRPALRWLLGRVRSALGARGSGPRATVATVDVDPHSMM
jgi:primosomal protein N' (replication factor Y)